ncbi:putative glycoside hydrolase [Caminicella sporogenes]|nr:putative glycoside hydrolase [Caminicella sporogenes]
MVKKGIAVFLIVLVFLSIALAGCSIKTTASIDGQEKDESVTVIDSEENKTEDEKAKDEKEQDDLEKNKQISEKSENIVYISASKLNVRAEGSKDAKIIGSVVKGLPVKVLDKLTNEAGEVTWYKIEFENEKFNNEGWISAKYTVADRMELLGEAYRDLDLSPQAKVEEYEGNPRVKVKGVYVTIHSASNSRLDKLIEMAKETDINAFVIDVKDDNGNVLFPTKTAEKFGTTANNKAPIKNIEAFMKKLKENNIYAIARIVSFKDPKYARAYPDKAITYKKSGKPFTNRDGIIWVSPHDRNLWEYNISIAKEAAEVGFNEIQFDYVRFPASNGGKMDKYLDYKNTLGESKPLTIQRYLKYAREELSPLKVYISADIYGLVGSVADDMGIGQYWEAISNIVDYVCPMMYPSHYGNGVYGLSVPDAYPYETIDRGIKDALMRNKNIETPAIIRPWIQDFTATWVKGHVKYGIKEVKAQIRALEDNGVSEFLLWNPANRYTEGALK